MLSTVRDGCFLGSLGALVHSELLLALSLRPGSTARWAGGQGAKVSPPSAGIQTGPSDQEAKEVQTQALLLLRDMLVATDLGVVQQCWFSTAVPSGVRPHAASPMLRRGLQRGLNGRESGRCVTSGKLLNISVP